MRPLLTAEIIAVGTELLTPTRLDTNSLFITKCLAEYGITVRTKAVVGDSRDDLNVLTRPRSLSGDHGIARTERDALRKP